MRTVTSVTMVSIPSLPVTRPSQSYPAASRWWPPTSMTSPSMVTMRRPSRLLAVTPYFRQCAPPEFIPTLPPIMQASWLLGSGA